MNPFFTKRKRFYFTVFEDIIEDRADTIRQLGHIVYTLSSYDGTLCKEHYNGKLFCNMPFSPPGIETHHDKILSMAFFILAEQYSFDIPTTYGKITIGYTLINRISKIRFQYTLKGDAISLFQDDKGGPRISKAKIFRDIEKKVLMEKEKYKDSVIVEVFLSVYYRAVPFIIDFDKLRNRSKDDIIECIVKCLTEEDLFPTKAIPKSFKWKSLTNKITSTTTMKSITNKKDSKRRSFIVADLETVMIDGVQVPYAIGYLLVKPGDNLSLNNNIHTFSTENYSLIYTSFEQRSYKFLKEFFHFLLMEKEKEKTIRTIYFHNLGRFDGLFLMKWLSTKENFDFFKPKTLIRNNKIYEIKIYKKKKLLFRFRDSLNLLPAPLESLGKTFCPELGSKGSIPHEEITPSYIQKHTKELLDYMKQDIVILGGIMLKAQDIFYTKYSIDVENVMTISSLALKIFKQNYFDDSSFEINIPNANEDEFIRSGYYGGHVDVYIPYGENLYYYDVNSLYPFVMQSFDMPSGKAVWKKNLQNEELDTLYGFIEAYISCPETITRPFLPFKKEDGTLIFPTGKWISVYYSEELKLAKSVGYSIIPLKGYLFNKKESPFKTYVDNLYMNRLQAKKDKNKPLDTAYKLLMNSLYGRFGMNPVSVMTEIVDKENYEKLLNKKNFISGEKLHENVFIVRYNTNIAWGDSPGDWKAPKESSIQLAAAITACSRIYMYPYISRDDCYYTDTDSVILGSPLSEQDISSSELGKFKLENEVLKGIFLAPKCYHLNTKDNDDIIRHKGSAKEFVTALWFKEIYIDSSIEEVYNIAKPFSIDWPSLSIRKKNLQIKLGIPKSYKRIPIFDINKEGKKIWTNTKPVHVFDVRDEKMTAIMKLEESLNIKKIQNKDHTEISTSPDVEWAKAAEENIRKVEEFRKKHEEALKQVKKDLFKGKKDHWNNDDWNNDDGSEDEYLDDYLNDYYRNNNPKPDE